MIEFSCSKCDRPYKVADDSAGRRFRCKGCSKEQRVPSLPADDLGLGGLNSNDWEDDSADDDDRPRRKPAARSKGTTKGKAKKGAAAQRMSHLALVQDIFENLGELLAKVIAAAFLAVCLTLVYRFRAALRGRLKEVQVYSPAEIIIVSACVFGVALIAGMSMGVGDLVRQRVDEGKRVPLLWHVLFVMPLLSHLLWFLMAVAVIIGGLVAYHTATDPARLRAAQPVACVSIEFPADLRMAVIPERTGHSTHQARKAHCALRA